MRIIALRHGETTANRDRITQGQADTDLTENGYKQARQVAFDLKDESFDLIVSSDLKRCTETTAEVVKYHPNTPVIYDARLREYSYGIHQGKPTTSWDWPDSVDDTDIDAKAPGGESAREVTRRVVAMVNDLYEKDPTISVLFVTHGGVMRLLRVLTGEIEFRERMAEKIGNGSRLSFELQAPLEELR